MLPEVLARAAQVGLVAPDARAGTPEEDRPVGSVHGVLHWRGGRWVEEHPRRAIVEPVLEPMLSIGQARDGLGG